MSGSMFLDNLREVLNSKRILRWCYLIKENPNFWEEDITSENVECVTVTEDVFGTRTQETVENVLDENSAEVATGYVAKKLIKRSQYEENTESWRFLLKYIGSDAWWNVLSHSGLFVLSKSLADFVCSYFAILDFVRRQPMSCAVMDQNLILPVSII